MSLSQLCNLFTASPQSDSPRSCERIPKPACPSSARLPVSALPSRSHPAGGLPRPPARSSAPFPWQSITAGSGCPPPNQTPWRVPQGSALRRAPAGLVAGEGQSCRGIQNGCMRLTRPPLHVHQGACWWQGYRTDSATIKHHSPEQRARGRSWLTKASPRRT